MKKRLLCFILVCLLTLGLTLSMVACTDEADTPNGTGNSDVGDTDGDGNTPGGVEDDGNKDDDETTDGAGDDGDDLPDIDIGDDYESGGINPPYEDGTGTELPIIPIPKN